MLDRLTLRELHALDLNTRSLCLRADSIDEENRSVEAVLSTEAPVRVFDFRTFEIIDEVLIARGMQHRDQVILLEAHSRFSLESILGSIRNIRVENDQVVGRIFLAEGDERADSAWLKIRQGHLTDVSIGYRSEDGGFVDIPPGRTETINGKTYTATTRTLRVTTRSTLKEGSLVPIGADEAAQIREDRAGTTRTHLENRAMNKDQEAYLVSLGLPANASERALTEFCERMTTEETARLAELKEGKAPDAPTDPPGDTKRGDAAAPKEPEPALEPEVRHVSVADAQQAAETAVTNERKRIAEIRELAGEDVDAALVQRAEDEGWDMERTSREFVKRLREDRPEPAGASGVAIHSRSHEVDCTERALTAGLMQRCGLRVIDPKASDELRQEQQRSAEMGEAYAFMSMVDMCREGLRVHGHRMPRNPHEIIQRAISTGSMTNIFTSSVNARILASMAEHIDTTGPFVQETEVDDFKTNDRILMDKTVGLTKHTRGGEADDFTRGDQQESYKIARYSQKFTIDEMDLIDDRLNALTTIPGEMGRSAARLRPDLVYSIIFANAALGADGVTLFHSATHDNLNTTAGLTKTTLEAALTDMATQTQNGQPLGLFAANVIVPQALKITAKELVQSQTLITRGDTDGTFGSFNALSDEGLGVIADQRLDNGVIDPDTLTSHSGSATTWYLAARGGRHTIEVAYRRGTGRGPSLRSFILTEGKFGIGWDINLDIGAKALDFRGLHKNTA